MRVLNAMDESKPMADPGPMDCFVLGPAVENPQSRISTRGKEHELAQREMQAHEEEERDAEEETHCSCLRRILLLDIDYYLVYLLPRSLNSRERRRSQRSTWISRAVSVTEHQSLSLGILTPSLLSLLSYGKCISTCCQWIASSLAGISISESPTTCGVTSASSTNERVERSKSLERSLRRAIAASERVA